MFFDGSMLRLGPHLPDQWLFAAYWWLPSLLLVLSLPGWLRRLGVTPNLIWLATGLTLVAPATAWWSMFPVRILGFAVAGSYLMMLAVDRLGRRRFVTGVGQLLLAGLLLARMPTFYVPWSITLAVPVLLATIVWLIWDPAVRRWALVVCGGTGLLALALFGGVVLENHLAFTNELRTVYPGKRRSPAVAQGPAQLFDAPAIGYLQSKPTVVGSNYSELSTGFTFFVAWALGLIGLAPSQAPLGPPSWRPDCAHRIHGRLLRVGDGESRTCERPRARVKPG